MEIVMGILVVLIFALMALSGFVYDADKERTKFKTLYRRLILNREIAQPEQWKSKEPNYARLKLAVGQRKLLKGTDQIIQIEGEKMRKQTQLNLSFKGRK